MTQKAAPSSKPAEILDRALAIFPKTGWSDAMTDRLKDEFGLVTLTEHYPNGVIDLLYAFADRADQAMLAGLAAADPENLKIRARIRTGVQARLQSLAPDKAAFSASIKTLMHPSHASDLKRISWRTADRLWWAAGDRATDYNHYSKRVLLSGVFATTTLYWLKDSSDQSEKTWQFLDRRIDNVMSFGKFMGKFKKSA